MSIWPGFIAFTVELSGEFGLYISPENMHCFHFADVLLSCCVLLYIFECAWSSFSMHLIRREWDRISMKSVERVLVKLDECVEEVTTSSLAVSTPTHKPSLTTIQSNRDHTLRGCLRLQRIKMKLPWTALYHMRDEADFKIIQLIFKTQFHLKHNFDYVMYAKAVLEDTVVDLANISVYHWLGIVLFCMSTNIGQSLAADSNAVQWSMQQLVKDDPDDLDDGAAGGSRRQLGGGGKVTDPWHGCGGATLACGLNNQNLTARIEELQTNLTSNYTWSCNSCLAAAQALPADATESQLAFAIFVYMMLGVTLFVVHSMINTTLSVRMNKVLTFAGAHDPYKVKELMKKLQIGASTRNISLPTFNSGTFVRRFLLLRRPRQLPA